MRTIEHWINGTRVAGTSGSFGPVFDPATGARSAEVALSNGTEVDAAVDAAAGAFPAWRATSLSRRAEILFAARALIAERRIEDRKSVV